jgi:hypothetical protein
MDLTAPGTLWPGFLQAQCALLPGTFFGPLTDRAVIRWLDFLTKLRRLHTHLGASAVAFLAIVCLAIRHMTVLFQSILSATGGKCHFEKSQQRTQVRRPT